MIHASRALCTLAAFGVFATGCKTSDPEPERAAGEAPKRPARTATLYVDSTGEPLNVGGKKAEKADADGHAKGEFSPKDVLLPGMFVLVSGATTVGGALLIKTLDKKDKPAGPMYVAGGGEEGTFVPMDTSASAGSAGADSGPAGTGSGSAGTGMPAEGTGSASGTPGTAGGGEPEPTTATAVARESESVASKALATGKAVASTPSSVLLSMGYASHYTGPSYITAKVASRGTTTVHGEAVYIYDWSLTLDRATVSSGERVNVYATFSGLPESSYVALYIKVYGGATLICEHTPQIPRLTADTLPPDGTWVFGYLSSTDFAEPHSYGYCFKTPSPDTRVLLGYLSVTKETDVYGDSTAMVTVH